MKVTFVSNYINHHQIPLSNVLYERLKEDYTFIQTEPMEEERIKLGWNCANIPEYVKLSYEEEEACKQLILDSDVVIWGGLEDETMLQPRLKAGKPVIRYSERLYKEGQWKAISPRGLRKKYYDHTRYRKDMVYLLCAGAYVASDFRIVHAYPDKMLKWGYFPECKDYDLEQLMRKKQEASKLLWAARFIDWKHPELVVELAKELAKERNDFQITMIGTGELTEQIQAQIRDKNLEDYIILAGTKTPAQVREAMEEARIFLMTSDRMEGWGAVMNEAMNSGCVVIADRMEGATPYLIEHGVNGFEYRNATAKALAELVKPLLEDGKKCEQLGHKAYETIHELWNAKVAGERLLKLCEDMAAGQNPQVIWSKGPCSKAEIIKERS